MRSTDAGHDDPGIMASQCIVLLDNLGLGFALWALAALLWLLLTYTIFTAFTIRRDKPTLDKGISGAWLLADSFSRRGATWDAVGAYNAACSQLKDDACIKARSQYAWRVYRQLPAQRSAQLGKHLVATVTPIPSLMSVRVSP